jgi:hypothetical protein
VIHLGDAYEHLGELLKDRGLGDRAYSIDVVVWNHRRDGEGPSIRFTTAVMAGPGGCLMAHERPTLEDAVTELDRLVAEWQAPKPEPITDLRVSLPDEVPSAAEPAAAEQPF